MRRLAGRASPLPRAAYLPACGLGFLITIENALYLLALQRSPVSIVTPLFFTYPAMIVAFHAIRKHMRVRPLLLSGLVLDLAGVSLLAGAPSVTFHSLGIVFALLSGSACAAMMLLAEASMQRYGEQEMTRAMATAAIPIAGVAALFGAPLRDRVPLSAWGGVSLSCILYGGSAVMFFAGMGRIGAASAAALSTLEPVVAVLAGVLILGEPLTSSSTLGTTMILVSLWLLSSTAHPPIANRE